jgi:hypothetical protein
MSFDDDDTTEAHERRQIRCKAFGCNRRIIFLPTESGSKMPVDADSVLPADEEFDPARHISHFASCPGANKYRKRT